MAKRLGLPGLGFFVFESLMDAIMPPSIASARCFNSAACTVLCEQ